MGKTFHLECPQCHYRANVCGGAASGKDCDAQTIVCRDCRELFDVFIRVRRRTDEEPLPKKFPAFHRPEIPPGILRNGSFHQPGAPAHPSVWEQFKPTCPVQPKHFVEVWKDPGRCPRCGNFMEKNGFAFRLWD